MAQNRWEAAVAEYKSSGSSGSGKAGNSSGASNRWDAAVSEYKKYGAENYKAIGERRKLEREIKSTTTNYVKEFTKNENAFYSAVNNDFEGENGFNAAEYFEERQKQASALKAQAAEIYRYFEENADSYDPEYYYKITEYLTGVDKSIEETMSRYQPSLDSKAGMAAYEDEYIAAMERNAQLSKLDKMVDYAFDPGSPAASFMQSFRQYQNDESYRAVTDNWTDAERYELGLLQKEDPAKAREYAIQLNNYYNAKATEQSRQQIRDQATDNIFANTGKALAASMVGAGDIFDRVAEHAARGRTTEKDYLTATDYANETTGAINAYLNDRYGTVDTTGFQELRNIGQQGLKDAGVDPAYIGGAGNSLLDLASDMVDQKGVGDIYNFGYSLAQNLASRYTLGMVGGQPLVLANYFANAATSAIDDARRRGATGNQAMGLGLIKGALEVGTEFIPTSELFKMGPAVTVKDFLKAVGVEALEEFVGEGANALGGYIADKKIMGDLSEFETAKRKYMEEYGMTEEQAHAQAIKDAVSNIVFEGFSGALSGAVSGGAESAIRTGLANQYYRNVNPQSLIDAGMQTDADSKAYQMAMDMQQKVDSGQKVSGNQKRVLAYNTELQQLAEAKVAAENAAMEDLAALGETENVESLAKIVAKRTVGEELTRKEKRTAERSSSVQTLFDTMDTMEDNGSVGSEDSETVVEMPKVSKDGKAIQMSTNEAIETLDFASVNKGKATVQLKSGDTAEYSDVVFASEADANQFYAVASLPGIDTENANDLLHTIQDADAGKDVDSVVGIREAYGMGYFGMQESDLESGDAANLSPELRKAVFDIGRQQRTADAMVKATAKPVAAKPSAGYKKVVFEGKTRQITEKGKAEIAFVDYIADNFSGNTVHVFESYKGRDGKYYYRDNNGKVHRAPNGKYVNGEIWLDLKAGNNQEGLVLNTFAHEMYHHIEKFDKAKAQELAEFVAKELGKKSVDDAVAEQIKKARKAGLGESYFQRQGMTAEQARNEVYMRAMSDFVADSLETMFTRGDPAKAIANLKKENRTLFDEIKAFIDKWVSKVKEFYKDKTISKEGEMVAQLEKFEQLQQLFMEAVQSAGENYRAALSELTPGEAGEIVNADGDPVAMSTDDGSVMLSIRTYEEDGRSIFRNYLDKCVTSNRLTAQEAKEMRDGIEEIYNVCKEFKDKYAPFSAWSDAEVIRDTRGRPVFSVVTPNGDYKMNLDFSLVCKKRRTLDAVFNEMSRRGIIDDFELGQKSVVKINEIIRKYDLETACSLCFVDAKRFRQASMADSFVRLYNELVESLVPEERKGSINHFNFSGYETIRSVDGGIDTWDNSQLDFSHLDDVMKRYGKGTVEHKAAKYIKSRPEARKLLLRGDFMSSQGFDEVKTQNQDILKLYNSKKGTGGPKAAFGDVQYLNEIIRKERTWTPAKAYEVGGVRIQSFSDYIPRMVFDYTQMIYDLAARKMPAHAYTKETLFVKQFGLTGVKINMSLIPAVAKGGIAPGLDAKGNYVWAGESFDYNAAIEIQNAEGYSENCGTICVGVSDAHIRKLLRDPNIRMVIPYHKSGLNPIVAHMNKIGEFKNYTDDQRTKGKDGKAVSKDFNFNEAVKRTGDPKAAADEYLKWCAENGYTAKFAEFAKEENYYKLLEDFTLYDKDGKYVPQREVRAVFPNEGSAFGTMKGLIKAGLEEDAIVEGKRDKNLSSIVDEIQKTLPKTEAEISEEQVAQADRDLEAYSLRNEKPGKKESGKAYKAEQKDLIQNMQTEQRLIREALSELTPGDAGEIVSDNGEADVKYSDRDYLAAVKRGDTENAQRMVDEAAKKAGYNSGMIYHGTPKFGFTWFDLGQMDDGISIFATSDRKIAESYSGETDRDTISDRELKNVDEMSDPELLKYVQRYIDPKYQIATESQRRSLLNHYVEAFDTVRRDLVQIAEDNPNAFSREGLSKLHEMADIIDEMSRSHDVRKLKNLLDKYTDERASLWKRNPAARELMERDYGNALGSFMKDFIGVSLDNIYGNIKEISNKDSLFVTNEANSAEYLPVDIARKQLKKRTENGIYGLYAKTDNLFEFDANGEAWNRIDGKHIGRDGLVTTREVAEYAKKAGYNGVKIRNLRDAGGRTNYYEASDIYTLFDSAQVKSADTVTYDDSGNVIPLSERFNEKNADIRYSYRDTNQDGSEVYETGKDIKKTAYKDEQKKLINDMLTEQRVIREELTGKESDITIMEREFIRLAKKYEQMDTRTGKSSIKDANTIAKLKADLRAEAKSHRDDSKIWEREFNRLLRDYETSGRQIDRLEATIQRQRATAKARVEGRRKTEMRHKIQRKANELNQLLLHGTKHRNIPESMQPAVADILKAINMEVRDGEQRRKTFEATVARYDQQIALATDPLVKEALIEKRDNYVAKGDQFANKMAKLQAAYKEVQDNKVPNLEIDEGLASQLDTLFEKVGDTPLGQMTMAQLEAVNDVLNITNATITNANKLFQEGQRQGIEETSKSAMREVRSVGGGAKKKLGVQEAVEAFNWNNQKPIYAVEAIGSNTLTSMFKNLRKGEDTLAVDLQEGKTFFQNQWKKHKGKDWDMEKKWKFTSTSGKAFELDLNQIMSLYALSKRDQARDHLRVGGFSFDSQYKIKDEVKVGPVRIKAEVKNTDASAYNLSDEILGEIIGKLTTEQRAFVDEMQAYLSDTMAAKGNEISMKKYGIRLFKEKNYFPLRVSDQYMARAREQQTGDRKLKNSGFTKETTPNAKNPVVLSSFTEVWAEHVDEMSLYHSFVLPLDDMSRVLNYHDQFTEETAAGSVVEAIRTAYGEEATKYIEQLIRDVNGGARSDSMARAINNMMSKAKKAQTMASLSVAIQQPSAILRACSMVDGKYFLGRKVTEKSHNSTWEEIKAHAPIAIIKEMGGFDTNVGKSTTDYLTDTAEYDGFGQQFKALFTDSKFRDDAFGKLPAMMDEMAWGAIWNAVKREQADKHPSMDVKSDAFMKLVADRFTDVIVHTQVYDSVFSRSGLMRSKDTGVKMATAFMAEPTTTINMLQNAILQAKRGEITGKDAAKTVGAIVSSLALNSALVSVVYAIRDDDEDKRLDEKWIENFHENFFESLNPIGYIPLLRDLQNKIRGFDVERADMTLWGDLINAFNGLQDEKLSALDKWEAVIGSVGNLFGIPLKNIIRDSKGVIQTLFDLENDEDGTLRIVFNKEPPKTKTGRYMAAMGMDLSDGEELLLAIQRGDDEHIQRVGGRFENQQKAESALQSAIREKYKNGDLTREEAEELLTTNFDRDGEHDVYWILDEWDYAKENGSSDGYAKFGNLYEAIENGGDYSAEMDRLLAHGSEESEIRSQITRNYHKQYLDGDETARQEIRDKLMPVMEAAGMDESDIADKFNSWDFEAEYGMTYSEFKSEYRDGNVTEAEMRDAMKAYGLLNYEIEEDIRSLKDGIRFKQKYDMSLSEMKDAYDDGDISRNQMTSALVFSGMTKSEAQKWVKQREIENRLGIEYAKLDDAYKHNDISRTTLYNAMIENGATKQEADDAILGYDWLKKNVKKYPDMAISDAKKFAVRISTNAPDYTLEDFGVKVDDYIQYSKLRPDCKGVDNNGDGQADSGTKRNAIFKMIDSLPISSDAKDGLALIDYGMKSILKNAPWH